MASSFINFIDCAVLKVLVPNDLSITISHNTILQNFNKDYAYRNKIYDNYIIYILYINQVNFGQWNISITQNNTTRIKYININDFKVFTVSFILPDEYQQIEYLAATGTQYINTELTLMDSFDIDFAYDELYSGETAYSILGHRTTGNPSYLVGITHWTGAIEPRPPTSTSVACTRIPIDYQKHSIQCGIDFGNKAIVDGVEKLSWTDPQTKSNNTTFLFAENAQGSVVYRSKSRIYCVKLWSNNTIQRDMYPCIRISDGVAGMYDLITNTFYTNAGTGTFITGPVLDGTFSPICLFNYGNENTTITNGLQAYPYRINGSSVTPVTGTKLKNSANIIFSHNSNSTVSTLFINKPIDLTNFSKICLNVTASSGEFALRITSNKTNNYVTAANITKTGNVTGLITLDITSIIGDYYIFIMINGSSPSITFDRWWLE